MFLVAEEINAFGIELAHGEGQSLFVSGLPRGYFLLDALSDGSIRASKRRVEAFKIIDSDDGGVVEKVVLGKEKVANFVGDVVVAIKGDCSKWAGERERFQNGREGLSDICAIDLETPCICGKSFIRGVADGSAVDLEIGKVGGELVFNDVL